MGRTLARAGLAVGFAGLAWLLADVTATAAPSPTVSETAPTDPAADGVAAAGPVATTPDVDAAGATAPPDPSTTWPGTADFGTGVLTNDGPATLSDAQPWSSQATTTDWSDAASWPDSATGGATAGWQGTAGWGGGASPWPGGTDASGTISVWAGVSERPGDGDWAQVWTGAMAAGWGTGLGAGRPGTAAGVPLIDDEAGPAVSDAGPAADTAHAGSPVTAPLHSGPADSAAAPQLDAAVAQPGQVVPAKRRYSTTADTPAAGTTGPTAGPSAAPADDPATGPALHPRNPPAHQPAAPVPVPAGSTGTGSSSSGTSPQCPVGTVANCFARLAAEPCAWTTAHDHEAPIWRSERATTSPD